MCGIAALFAYHSDAPEVQEGELTRIRDDMRLRGPDGEGSWFDSRRRIGLGHRRLSIIDLSPGGAQPMLYPERDLAITFNGEIYNYKELKAELEAKGHHFKSQSDTEVLLHLYAEHGREMLNQLRGMFAFAIWDGKKQELFLARDPFGIKPLYYSDDGKTFRVASQVKALIAGGAIDLTPAPAGHVGFFLWGHIPEPYTLYQNIRSLPAGSFLTISRNGAGQLQSFCNLSDILARAEQVQDRHLNRQELHQELRSALLDSVRHHLIADVPVGVFLSSGMDSTTLAALASELGSDLRTVTLAFEEFNGTEDDEAPLAEKVARHYGAKHQTIRVTRHDFEQDLQHLLDSMDQPTNDGVNSFFISKAAAQAGLKVALSGLGGDELFGGYPSFTQIPQIINWARPFGSIHGVNRGFRFVSAPVLKRFTSPKYAGLLEYGGTYGGAYLLRRGMFMPWELPEFLDGEMVREGWNDLQPLLRLNAIVKNIDSPYLKISALEMSRYMRNQLLRDTDWAGMAHSLEVRTPLVDVEVLARLAPLFAGDTKPTKSDLGLTPSKPLPAEVLTRKKTGFVVPVRDWLAHAFDPSAGHERGLRGWAREIYSMFTDNLPLHRACLNRKRRKGNPQFSILNPQSTSRKLRILVLLTDGFGGFGGISKFNRDFLSALCSHEKVVEVTALPRLMPHDPGSLPTKLNYEHASLGGKKRYVRAMIHRARQFRRTQSADTTTAIICGHINLLPAALLARKISGGSLHLIIHGIDAWQPTKNFLANALVRRVDGFISVSNLTKRRFMHWSKLRDDQGIVLPNCVDLSAFTPGPKSETLLDRYCLHGKKVIMTLGRLASEERYKGFDEVLNAMPQLAREIPNIVYLICGDGPDRPRLVKKAQSLGLRVMDMGSTGVSPVSFGDSPKKPAQSSILYPSSSFPQVIFAGKISEAEKAGHYHLADLYVMPSSGEGFGIVFLEALACGISVIGSKADASREALLGGKLGALVDPRDPEEVLSTILRVLKQSSSRNSLGRETSGYENPKTQTLDSVDHFSAARFEQRVHDIIDCIRT